VRCSLCAAPAVVDQPYRGAHVCADHLARAVEARFRRELNRQLPRFTHGTVAIALSGGKDSAVALALAHRYLAPRPGVRLVAISVDEGIEGYRSRTLESASALTRALGVAHVIVRAEVELGTTTDRLARGMAGAPPCSYCGVWRRRLLNRAARAQRADALVLGFNLDDLAQTVLMNLVRGETDRLARMAPHRESHAGLVPRIAPLAQVPEREVFLYALHAQLPFDHAECPHAGRALRNRFRAVVWELESALPGTRQTLLRTRDRIVELLPPGTGNGARSACRECGEPAASELCRACELLRTARAAAPPPEVA
jgi:uncharacterized protein (TIGR00269 family)